MGASTGPITVQYMLLMLSGVLFCPAYPGGSWPGDCPPGCTCSGIGTTCAMRDPGDVLTSVPPGVPPGTAQLLLMRQDIDRIGPDDFWDPSYNNLSMLLLVNTSTQVIEDGAFLHLGELTALHIVDSEVSSIGADTLGGLEKLETLNFRGNRQLILQPCALSFLPNLERLFLIGNPVTNFTMDLFVGEGCTNGTISPLENMIIEDQPIGITSQDWLMFPSLSRLTMENPPQDLLNTPFLSDLTNLEELFLETEVSYFPRSFFQNDNVHAVTIRDSSISGVPANAFPHTPKLESLEILRTPLASIHPEALSGLQIFTRLELTGTDVRTLPSELFSSQRDNWFNLVLEDNQLETLPEGFIPNLDHVYMMHLGGNPWVCDCSLHWIIVFLRQNPRFSYYDREEPVCAAPAHVANVTFRALIDDRDNITGCEPPTTTIPIPTTRVITTTPTYVPPSPTTEPGDRYNPGGTSRSIGSYWFRFVLCGVALLVVFGIIFYKCYKWLSSRRDRAGPVGGTGSGGTARGGGAAVVKRGDETQGLRDVKTADDSSKGLVSEQAV